MLNRVLECLKVVLLAYNIACIARIPVQRAFLHSGRARKLEHKKKIDEALSSFCSCSNFRAWSLQLIYMRPEFEKTLYGNAC